MKFVRVLACSSICLPVQAQEAQPPYEEIVVAARKRPESVLKVPVVQSVLTDELLERNQVTTLNDIAAHAPGIVLGTGAADTGTQISLRGVGTSITDAGVDQSVSMNIDGLQVTQGAAYSVGTFDMAQVEILRGPQALFFGKASSGGVVSIRSADPGDELELIGRLGYEAEAREWRGEAIVSGPVSDALGLRLATQYSDSNGFFENVAVADRTTGAVPSARRSGGTDTLLLRGTAVFEPSSSFSARMKLNYSQNEQTGGTAMQLASCPDGTEPYPGVPVSFFSPAENCKLDRDIAIVDLNPAFFGGLMNDGVPFTDTLQSFGTLELSYDLRPELTVTSVTGFYDIDVDALYNGTLTGDAAPFLAAEKRFGRREYTQELRLNSELEQPLNFTVGAFYQNGDLSSRLRVAGNSYFQAPRLVLFAGHDVDIESTSLFGQLRFNPVAALEVSAGARWTHEVRSDRPESIAAGARVFADVPELRSDNWSPEITVAYLPSDDLTLFGSVKQAYKSGSYNLTVAVLPGQDNSFGDEKVRGGEAGMKARIADRQVSVDLAGYYYEYEGLQTGAMTSQAGGIPIFRVQNAGASRIYGVDFDAAYSPQAVPGLRLYSAVNWNHARFTDFATAPCWGGQTIAEGCNLALNSVTGLFTAQDLSGARIPRAPEWMLNLGVDHEVNVGDALSMTLGVNGQYASEYLSTLGRRPDFVQSAHTKMNANVALRDAQDRWEVALIGSNLFDTHRAGYCSAINFAGAQAFPGVRTGGATRGASGMDELSCVLEQGRQLWVRLTFKPAF